MFNQLVAKISRLAAWLLSIPLSCSLLEKDQKMNEKDAGNALFLKHVKYKKGKRVLNEIVKYGTT